jgi:excisionase family DNA binding protein
MTYTKAEPEFLTTDEAAALISVTPRTIQRLKYDGKLAFMKMGSRIRFRRSNVLALLKPGFPTAPVKSWTPTRFSRDADELPAGLLRPVRKSAFAE